MAKPRGPLDGVKVIACSTAQAGTVPYMLMADLGAETMSALRRASTHLSRGPVANN